MERDNLPRWNGERGRYEAWFLTLTGPSDAYWIRYSLRAPVAGPPEPRLWFARFNRDDPSRTFGINGAVPVDLLRRRADSFEVHLGDAVLGSGQASGAIKGAGHAARWDLAFDTGGPTFRLLPAALYVGGLAPTKPLTPNPAVRFSGVVEVDGEVLFVEGAPGHQGHVYGTRHADRWAWASCGHFETDGYAFEAVCAQGSRGPFRTPFATFAGLRLDGEWIRLRSVSASKPWALGEWRIAVGSRHHRLEGRITAPAKAMVRARYLDPDDTPRWCHNSEIASSRLVLWERAAGGWRQVDEMVSDGTTHAEWAGRTPAPGVDVDHVELP